MNNTRKIRKKLKNVLKKMFPRIVLTDSDIIRNNIDFLITINPEKRVRAGPFANMKYPDYESFGSALAPKILGTYEAELHDVIREIIISDYDTIIDVGCAEGYYAVGLGREMPYSTIYAYDTNSHARNLCQKMAEMNEVKNRVIIEAQFNLGELINLGDEIRHGFIICDVEGAEVDIFRKDLPGWDILKNRFDLLVEIHEHLRPGIKATLIDNFQADYSIEIISTVPDRLRPSTYPISMIQNCSLKNQRLLLAEFRSKPMEWLYMKRKVGKK